MNPNENKSHWLVGKGKAKSVLSLGRNCAYWMRHSPRRMLRSMAYYKFAARMIGTCKTVLDIGCGEGLGTWLLAMECGNALGIDLDDQSIAIAKANWNSPKVSFECRNLFQCTAFGYDGVVSFDALEHLPRDISSSYLKSVADHLVPEGVAIVGTANITGQQYALDITKMGCVNLYSSERLEMELRAYFKHVFIFAASDEVVHTGFLPMAQYLIALACFKK